MFVDIHAHLDFYKEEELDRIIQHCRDSKVIVIAQGVNYESNKKVLDIAIKYPDIVKSALGIYPLDAPNVEKLPEDGGRIHHSSVDFDEILKFIEDNKNKIIAIGEVGLDFKYSEDKYNQINNMRRIIELAKKIKKPIIVHSRKAEKEILDLFEDERMFNVVMHCFSGNKKLIQRGIDLGLYFSVPAVIKKLEHFQMLVQMVPLSRLFTETDSPYLSPEREEKNEPKNVKVVVEWIAKIKSLSFEETEKAIFKNYQDLFL